MRLFHSRLLFVLCCADEKGTWARMTSLYANRTGLDGTPIRVKSGTFTYELTFVKPHMVTSEHSFHSAPIIFDDELKATVIGFQNNVTSGTMLTMRRVLIEEEPARKKKPAEPVRALSVDETPATCPGAPCVRTAIRN